MILLSNFNLNLGNIEVVDLTPQDLLQRFKEGKVYAGDTPLVALNNFFKEEKLTALREIVLRFSANIVDEELINKLTSELYKSVGIEFD